MAHVHGKEMFADPMNAHSGTFIPDGYKLSRCPGFSVSCVFSRDLERRLNGLIWMWIRGLLYVDATGSGQGLKFLSVVEILL